MWCGVKRRACQVRDQAVDRCTEGGAEAQGQVRASMVPILLALKAKPLRVVDIARATNLPEAVVGDRIRRFIEDYGASDWLVRLDDGWFDLSTRAHRLVDRCALAAVQTETYRENERLRRQGGESG